MRKNINKLITLIFILLFIITLSACDFSGSYIINEEIQNIAIGESTVLSLNNNEKAVWSSSNEKVATVNEYGIVTGVGAGITTITATVNDKTYSMFISVDVKETEATLEISGNQTVYVNEAIQLKAKLYNTNKKATIYWESSNEKIATVNQDGQVTGKSAGIVTIKASAITNSLIEKEYTILVRTSGSILEDTVSNYIEHKVTELDGTLDLTSLNDATIKVVEKNYQSTIGVSNYINYFGKLERNGIGTGVIFKKETSNNKNLYYVLTNNHVVKDAAVLKVYLGDDGEKEVEATCIAKDTDLDLAVLTFSYEKEIPLVTFGNMDEVKTGQFVVALGNPEGYEYYGSATFGMISYVNRTLSGEKSNFIQHDAAINPGNSGGPLFNLKGEVIGINTIKLADEDIDNMGFSIALDTILKFLSDNNISIK